MPEVTVIIPTYNRAETLCLAIKSVLNQTFQDFEILVVDDASKDHTKEAVSRFKDKRIKYIRHETNKKEAGTRNTGVRNSNGRYIAFLDDDDEWLSEKLEKQVYLLEHGPSLVGGIYTGSFQIDRASGKTLTQIIPTKRGDIFRDMLSRNYIGTPSVVLLKKECFEKVGLFDESILFGPDYDMWLRISKEFHFEYIRDPLTKYYVHDNRLSTNYEIMIRGSESLIEKYGQLFASDSKSYSFRYFALGALYCYNGDVTKGRKAFFKAINLYPFEIRHYFYFCLSLLGPKYFKKYKEMRDELAKPRGMRLAQ